MRHLHKIFILIFFLTYSINYAQLDTLNYLKQFEANKSNYIGQPFSKLLNDMTQIQPKTAWSFSLSGKKTLTSNTRFKFCEMDYTFHNVITLLVEWQNEIPRDETKYYELKNAFYFSNDERNFYGNKIVKNIKVFR